jgi:gluconolactonase
MTIEALTWGYGLIEGPRAEPSGGVYFSDVHQGGIRRWNPDGTVDLIVPKRRGVGGIALHADGGLVLSGRNVCHVRNGETRIVYERADVGGFNDLFTDSQGRVYVGSLRDDPFTVQANRRSGDCYRIDTTGEVETLYTDVGLSNGIGFSPDGRILYHSDSAIRSVVAHDVDENGDLVTGSRRIFTKLRATPDGLAVDTDGGVWVAAYGEGAAIRFNPDGTEDRRVEVPATAVTSLCFYGDDLDELIVVTADNTEDESKGGTMFRVTADVVGATGVPAPLARV